MQRQAVAEVLETKEFAFKENRGLEASRRWGPPVGASVSDPQSGLTLG
jgi:hypothetical protein